MVADDATLRRQFSDKGIISDQHNHMEQSILDARKGGVVRPDKVLAMVCWLSL
jgi:hypothetical protein